jgi:predicted alpha/beta superfamily hydrolase
LVLSPLFFCIFFNPGLYGQERQVIKDSIYSHVLKEIRVIEVLLPNGYKGGSGEKYGVAYKLDGEWDRWLIPGSYDFAVGASFVPDQIFVRIPNRYKDGVNLRVRDFFPRKEPRVDSVQSGADKFRSFLRDELLPYINKNYSTNGESTLVGASLAGLFTIYTFLKEPQLFKSYVTVDPSLWWENEYISELALKTFPSMQELDGTTLWIAGRQVNLTNLWAPQRLTLYCGSVLQKVYFGRPLLIPTKRITACSTKDIIMVSDTPTTDI